MPPRVSINLCCYNSEKYLEETLQSIFAQTYTDWELVIVNDGSTDSTEEIIRRSMKNGRRIIYHYQANAGLGNARNKAAELSSGDFIALIDHDDLWIPNKLERQIRLFEENPELGLVYCDGYLIDASGTTVLRHSNKYPPAQGYIFDRLVRCSFIPPVSAVIKRNAFDAVGPFPDFRTAEEFALFLKITYRYPVDYVDEPLYKYRLHPESLTQTGTRERYHQELIEIRKYWMDQMTSGNRRLTRQLKNLASSAYGGYGTWLLEQGRKEAARQNFACSIKLYPLQLRYLYYVLSWFPPPITDQVLIRLRTGPL